MSPSPHFVIENFFPPEFYAKLLQYNPFKANVGQEWMARDDSDDVSSKTPYYARKQINFHLGQHFEAAPAERRFWDDLQDCFLADDWFPQLIIDKFPTYFDLRFGDAMRREDFIDGFRRELFLQRHEPGYYIGPHTDIPTRVFTCIFSFADREGYEEFGTELVAPKDPMARCWGNDHHHPDLFEVRTVAPYRPNNFLLFFKTRHSFHSVKTIPEDMPGERYGMQFQFYEPPQGYFKDLSAPYLMQVIRPNQAPASPTLKQRIKYLLKA